MVRQGKRSRTVIKLALMRKTGYVSKYSLGMIYPSYRKGLEIQGPKGEWVAPIIIPLSGGRYINVWPPLVRFPSWLARKARNLTPEGFVKP